MLHQFRIPELRDFLRHGLISLSRYRNKAELVEASKTLLEEMGETGVRRIGEIFQKMRESQRGKRFAFTHSREMDVTQADSDRHSQESESEVRSQQFSHHLQSASAVAPSPNSTRRMIRTTDSEEGRPGATPPPAAPPLLVEVRPTQSVRPNMPSSANGLIRSDCELPPPPPPQLLQPPSSAAAQAQVLGNCAQQITRRISVLHLRDPVTTCPERMETEQDEEPSEPRSQVNVEVIELEDGGSVPPPPSEFSQGSSSSPLPLMAQNLDPHLQKLMDSMSCDSIVMAPIPHKKLLKVLVEPRPLYPIIYSIHRFYCWFYVVLDETIRSLLFPGGRESTQKPVAQVFLRVTRRLLPRDNPDEAPNYLTVVVNGTEISPGTEAPIDITRFLLRSGERDGENSVRMQWPPSCNIDRSTFYAGVYLHRNDDRDRDPRSFLQDVIKNHSISHEDTRKAIIATLHDEDSDTDCAASNFLLSLKCPLSRSRVEVPCKGSRCRHLQVFDGLAFLTTLEARGAERQGSIRCPICGIPLPREELRVDEYLHRMLHQLREDVSEVALQRDGSWRLVEESIELGVVTLEESYNGDDSVIFIEEVGK